MAISKFLIQAVIVVTWGTYVFFEVLSDLQTVSGENTGAPDWVSQMGAYPQAISLEPLVLSVIVMAAALVGLEVAFAIIDRIRNPSS